MTTRIRNMDLQRKYQRECYKKNPRKKYAHIKYVARKLNPISKKCSVPKCKFIGERHHPDYTQPNLIVWLCRKHHSEIHHKEIKKCSIGGCNKKHRARGFCISHYMDIFYPSCIQAHNEAEKK